MAFARQRVSFDQQNLQAGAAANARPVVQSPDFVAKVYQNEKISPFLKLIPKFSDKYNEISSIVKLV